MATADFLQAKSVIPSADWMSQLSNDTYVYELSIPGTHDSHAIQHNTGNIYAPWAQTQQIGITSQLRAGVRYVDLRVGEGKRMRHGAINLDGELHNCLQEIKNFLNEHPKETVLVHVMWDHPGVSEPGWFVDHVKDEWFYTLQGYSGDTWPTLGRARGQAILLHRFDSKYREKWAGINVNGLYNSDHSETQVGRWHSRPMGHEGKCSPGEIWDWAYQHVVTAMNTSPKDEVLWITNIAGAADQFTLNDDRLPRGYANALMPKLRDFLSQQSGKTRMGVVQMDFIDEYTSSLIWNRNFA